MSLLIWHCDYLPFTAFTSSSRYVYLPFIHRHLAAIHTASSVRCRHLGCRPSSWHTHTQWRMALLLKSGRTQSYVTHVCENVTLCVPVSGEYALSRRQKSLFSYRTQSRNPDWNAAQCSNWAADCDKNNGSNDRDGWPAPGLPWVLPELCLNFFLKIFFSTWRNVCKVKDIHCIVTVEKNNVKHKKCYNVSVEIQNRETVFNQYKS